MLKKNKGGRPRGAVSKKRVMAMEILTQLETELGRQVNPLEGLLRIGSDPAQPVSIRVTCMTECLPYLWPKLQSQSLSLTGRDEGPIAIAGADLTALIMGDPAAVEAAQTLALLMARPDCEALDDNPAAAPADEPRALPAPAPRDPLDTLQKDNKGHWV